jgi:hypothetical protein
MLHCQHPQQKRPPRLLQACLPLRHLVTGFKEAVRAVENTSKLD